MGVLLSAYQISKSFGAQKLFFDISFSIDDNQKIALIGPNGAGKSTLLKILSKSISPDSGQITFSQNLCIGYLEQNPKFNMEHSIYDAILEAGTDKDDPSQIALTWELFSRFSFAENNISYDMNVRDLSGGWQKKVALAREMAKRPNLLLLDEPTNHLDIESIIWLEEWIERQDNLSCLIVTHDRLFLQNTCDRIFDLDRKNPDGLIKFEGDYAGFLELKSSLLESQARLEEAKKNILRTETAWLKRGAKARQTKQKARIERAQDLKEEVQILSEKRRERLSKFEFTPSGRLPKKLIEAQNISKSFDHKVILKNVNFTLMAKSRVGIIGTNGSGKSTLIKVLLGLIPADDGQVKITDGVHFSYFEQKKENLDLKNTVLRNICPEGDYVHWQEKPVFARSYLNRFHFRPEQMDMPVSQLSGGEQSRLLLAKMMLRPVQILVLDEPTNDLDVDTLDTFQEALEEYPGAILLVTHDRYFLDQVSTEIIALDGNGHIEKFSDYFQWESWQKQSQSNVKDASKKTHDGSKVVSSKNVSDLFENSNKVDSEKKQKKKLTYKDQLELNGIEDRILKEEESLSCMQKQLEDPQIIASYEKLAKLTEEITHQQEKVNRLYQRWQELVSN